MTTPMHAYIETHKLRTKAFKELQHNPDYQGYPLPPGPHGMLMVSRRYPDGRRAYGRFYLSGNICSGGLATQLSHIGREYIKASTGTFEAWAQDTGMPVDSRRAQRAYRVAQLQGAKLSRLLSEPGAFDAFLEAVPA